MLEKTKSRREIADEASTIAATDKIQTLLITRPNFQYAKVTLTGKTPLVMNRMSSGNRTAIIRKQEEGSRSRKGQKRDPKDFNAVYEGAMHRSSEGWFGFPASAS
jgi:hypothetical protein